MTRTLTRTLTCQCLANLRGPPDPAHYPPDYPPLHVTLPHTTATLLQIAIYQSFDDVVKQFGGYCVAALEVLNQPVPFPYFHVSLPPDRTGTELLLLPLPAPLYPPSEPCPYPMPYLYPIPSLCPPST